MVRSLHSLPLLSLFNQAFATLPPQQRTALEGRCFLVTDDPLFLPPSPVLPLSAVLEVTYRKSIYIVYLNATRLLTEPEDFVCQLICHALGVVPGAR